MYIATTTDNTLVMCYVELAQPPYSELVVQAEIIGWELAQRLP